MDDLYEELVASGVEIGHHESDLHVPVTPVTTAIIAKHRKLTRFTYRQFVSQLDNKAWYDLPFMYKPFWDRALKDRQAQRERLTELLEHKAAYPRSKSADHAPTWEEQYPDAAEELTRLMEST